MEEFIHMILDIGIQLKVLFPNHSLDVKDIFRIGNINIMTEYIRIAGDEVKGNVIQKVKYRFVNLEIDSGTVSKLCAIHFVVSIPEQDQIRPFLYHLSNNSFSNSLSYSFAISSVVNDLLNENINICAIIADNLRAQTKGLEIMKQLSNNPLIKSIYIIHCFCHLVSLVFSNVTSNNEHLSLLIDKLKKIVNILRMKSSAIFIGKKCPKIFLYYIPNI